MWNIKKNCILFPFRSNRATHLMVIFVILVKNPTFGDQCSIENSANITAALEKCIDPISSLSLRDAKFSGIEWPSMDRIQNVSYIDISESKLVSIENVTFCKFRRLKNIDASKNSIKDLPIGMLAGCSNLVELTISQNQLSELIDGVFTQITSIKVLDLSLNQIVRLVDDVFKPLVHLENLRLNNNRITVIDGDLFANNPKLNILFLSGNLLETIGHGSFWKLKNLQTLDIGKNAQLGSIDLTEMDSLGNVEIDGASLSMLHIPVNVTQINAFGNKISRVQVDPQSRLHILHLGNNKISNLSDFSSLEQLQHLDLSNNGLTSIDFSYFARLKNLTHLIINSNLIKELNSTALLHYLPSLKILELSTDSMDMGNKQQLVEQIKTSHSKLIVLNEGKNVLDSEVNRDMKPKLDSSMAPVSISTTTLPSVQTQTQSSNQSHTVIRTPTPVTPRPHDVEKENLIQTLLNRIEILESKTDGKNSEEVHRVMEKSMANLRLMIICTILAFSLFVSIQIIVLVKRNQNRLRIPRWILPRNVEHTHRRLSDSISEEVL